MKQTNIIIPTLYALNEREFGTKLKKLQFSKNIHLDFMDGEFTKKKSVPISTYKTIKKTNQTFELHIMGYKPLKYLNKIKEYNIKKILIHVEIFKTLEEGKNILQKFKQNKIKTFLVINPQTRITKLYPFLKNSSTIGVMFMSVNPGKEGQKFLTKIPNKILRLKNKFPKTTIQIDGGINKKILQKLKNKQIPINIYSIGSQISSSKNPQKNFKELSKIKLK